MFTIQIEREAIEYYLYYLENEKGLKGFTNNFTHDGLKGLVAFDMFCTENPDFMLELCCTYLDHTSGIDAEFPQMPEVA